MFGLMFCGNPGFSIPFDSIFAKACACCGGVAERDCDAWSFFDVAFFASFLIGIASMLRVLLAG